MPFPVARILKGEAKAIAERYVGHRFPCIVPMETVWVRNKHAKHGEPFSFARPMFPGYVFFDLLDRRIEDFHMLQDQRFRLQLLILDGKPLAVRDGEMTQVLEFEQKLKARPTFSAAKKIEAGAEVQLIRGVLAKAYATVLSVRGGRVALVRLKGTQGKELFVNLTDLA